MLLLVFGILLHNWYKSFDTSSVFATSFFMVYCISAGTAYFPLCLVDGSRSTSAICVRYTWYSKRNPVNYTDVVIELISLTNIHLWYSVLAPHHIFCNSVLKFQRWNKCLAMLEFSHLNTASWLAAHPFSLGTPTEAHPFVDSCKRGVGGWDCWGLEDVPWTY